MTTPPMTPEEVAACRERCERATIQRVNCFACDGTGYVIGRGWPCGCANAPSSRASILDDVKDIATCALDTIDALRARLAEGEQRENGLREAMEFVRKLMEFARKLNEAAYRIAVPADPGVARAEEYANGVVLRVTQGEFEKAAALSKGPP